MKAKIEFDLPQQYIDQMQHLLTTDKEFSKALDDAIWQALALSRDRLKAEALSKIKNGDPHQSVRSIRRAVYKRIKGGSVSILGRGRGAGSRATQFRATGQSRRTQQINSYTGVDRDFILRFLNSGTGDRVSGHGRNTRMDANTLYSHQGKPGWRGKIDPRNFMRQQYMQLAADKLAQEIERYFNEHIK